MLCCFVDFTWLSAERYFYSSINILGNDVVYTISNGIYEYIASFAIEKYYLSIIEGFPATDIILLPIIQREIAPGRPVSRTNGKITDYNTAV